MAGNVSSPYGDPEDLAILDGEDVVDPNSSDETEVDKSDEEEQEILDELDSDKEEDPDAEVDKDDEKEDDKEDEDKEDPDEDNKRLGNHPGRPTYGQLKRYDPELLKKFPGLRDLVFREQGFTEVYATVEDAKDAAEQLTNYRAVEQNVTSGNPDEFLELLENYDNVVAAKFADTFLPTLAKTRPEVFQRVTQPYIKHVLKTAFAKYQNATEGVALNKKNAILHVHEEIFGDLDIGKAVNIPKIEPPPKDPQYEKEKEEFYTRKESDFRTSTLQASGAELKSLLTKVIDPHNALSEYDRRNIERDVREELDKVLAADMQHMSLMGSLWARAKKSGWSPEFRDRIKTTYLSRARILAPGIATKVRSEALKARNLNGRKKSSDTSSSSRPAPSGRPAGNSRTKEEDIDWKNSSDLDILNDTPKRKK